MFVKRYASQHVPIYLQPFPSNSTRKFKIYSNFKIQQHLSSTVTSYIGRKLQLFPTPLHLSRPLEYSQFPIEFRGKFIPEKTRIMGLPGSKDAVCSLTSFDTIPACDGQTDRWTERRPAYSYNVRSMTDAR